MQFIQDDYFNVFFPKNSFDGIITDMPYKGCIQKKLNEENFSFYDFLKKSYSETKTNAFLITFSNFLCAMDLISISRDIGWDFHTHLIWNKLPTRTWISWSHPLRHTEYIIFFRKGNYKFNFKNGIVKKAYKRSSFGGEMKYNKGPNFHQKSYGMYSEIINLPIPNKKNRVHPTEKPKEFSYIFSQIVGKDKFVLDPFAGSCNLLKNFENSIAIDINNYVTNK